MAIDFLKNIYPKIGDYEIPEILEVQGFSLENKDVAQNLYYYRHDKRGDVVVIDDLGQVFAYWRNYFSKNEIVPHLENLLDWGLKQESSGKESEILRFITKNHNIVDWDKKRGRVLRFDLCEK